MSKPLTDADIMTGFNPAIDQPAEDVSAQQDGAAADGTAPEGESTEGAVSSTPTEAEVTLDGRRFKAPKDIAEAFTREINRRDGTRGAELQGLRERLARLEGSREATPVGTETIETKGPQVPDPELQIENPAEYQRQLVAYIDHQQQVRTDALAQQYQEAEAAKQSETQRRAAWSQHVDTFYARPENEVLRENKDIVDLVLAQNREALAPLSVEEGFKALSRLAIERLAKVTGQAPGVKARTTPRPATLEGSSRRDAASAGAPAEDRGPKSLTQAIKERRRVAAESFAKAGAAKTPSPTR